jgi:hypothetical protein
MRHTISGTIVKCTLLIVFPGAIAGCGPTPEAEQGASVELSAVHKTSESLLTVRTNVPFRARVLSVMIRESTNIAAAYGITNSATLVTNLYVVQFRDEQGRLRALTGLNATGDQLISIRGLQEGKTYLFPEALIK